MNVSQKIIAELEQIAIETYCQIDNKMGACGEASGCSYAGECACHGDGYVW